MLLSSIKDKLLPPWPRTKLILASSSPRRAEILRNAGFAFEVRAAHIDETRRERESSRAYALRLAKEKAGAVAERMKRSGGAVVVGADTIVLAQGRILGKPQDVREARRMLRLISGRTHEVLTGVCLVSMPAGKKLSHVESTRVHFVKLSNRQIDDYIATGEPFDKAGAYAVQGIGARFIDRIEGCYFNVMGLPISRVWSMLRRLSESKG